MSFFRLLSRNLLYHRRGNFAVLLGVALGTAVLTGALLVGDSLRGSLRELALDQLGWVDEALVTGRFFRQALANEIGRARDCPAILLQGSAAHEAATPRRAGKVTVLGIESSFWPAGSDPADKSFWESDAAEAIINTTLAEALGAREGDQVTLGVQKADNVPRETLFAKRKSEDVLEALAVKVRRILPDAGMARFSLKPTPEPVRNAFVPLRYLQVRLALSGRANAILVGGATGASAPVLASHLTLEDWNLRLLTPEDRARAFVKVLDPRNLDQGKLKKVRWNGRVPEAFALEAGASGVITTEQIIAYYQKHHAYLSLESRQMYLEPAVEKAAREAIKSIGSAWQARPSLIYLADSIASGKGEMPYVVVAGVEPSELAELPALKSGKPLANNEILLADWAELPFVPSSKERITLTYYAPDAANHLQKKDVNFFFRGLFPLLGKFDDPDLTPEFQGITDKLDMASWENPPFPYNPKRVKAVDEEFWKRYRTTPRAYVTLEAAQRLWGSRFGDLTMLRITPSDDKSAASLRAALLAKLDPEQGGFVFQKVKDLALRAGAGATDFGQLFLAFSFFLIAAALLLVGLLFRLNIDRRAGEMGVLTATGWTNGQVRRLLLGEGAALAIVGGIVGLIGAVFYADLMLRYLQARWPVGASLSFLHFQAEPATFAIGYMSSLLVSVLTIVWATRVLAKLAPRALLAGQTNPPSHQKRGPWSFVVLVVALVGAAGCLVAGFLVHGQEAQAGSFFGSGAFLLTAGLAVLWLWLKRTGRVSTPRPTLAALGVRNAGRHLVRSVLTAGLLASATFLIVAVESFHKEPEADFLKREGGSGGFPLYAESDVPLYEDLNQPGVQAQLGIPPLPKEARIYACRVRAGDDASCLNLYQPLRPKILGVPNALMRRGGFSFAETLASADETKNPWLLLQKPSDDGAVPVFADANTAQWILKVGLGDVLTVPGDQGRPAKLKIVGLFSESIVQSELVMADSNFLRLFPRHEGFQYFLIDFPAAQSKDIQSALETALAGQGFFVYPTAERLRAYLAVENTYLATFQALGGLGLLLGAAGLAIVLLRGIWERRGELALLRALGFREGTLVYLVLAENAFLLFAGLAVGTLAAFAAVGPHLAGAEAVSLLERLAFLLGMVIAIGLGAGLIAAATTLRAPVLAALRRE